MIVIFCLKFNCCASVYILKFFHLKISLVDGAMEARKRCAKWRNRNISDIFFSSRSIERPKTAEAARKICAEYGDNAIGVSTARKYFSRFKEDRFDISDTARSGRPSVFDEDRLNTLIHNDPRPCIRELASPG